MEDLIYDGSPELTREVLEKYPSGDVRVLCPECTEELIVVLDEQARRRAQRHAGIFCPNGHVETIFELRSIHDRVKGLFDRLRHTKPDLAAAAIAEVESDSDGWVTCPGCGVRFSAGDARFAAQPDLWQHGCGQRLRVRTGTRAH